MYLDKNIEELSTLFVDNILETNRNFDVYVNWDNAAKINYDKFDIELNAMNSLIKNASKEKFEELFNKLPTFVCTFPLLIAISKTDRENLVKGKEELVIVDKDDLNYDFLRYDLSLKTLSSCNKEEVMELYYNFFVNSGLQKLFQNMLEKSVVDYVTGVLVGLDSNGRKNRSGDAFEITCEPIVREISKKYGIEVLIQKQFKTLEKFGFKVLNDMNSRKADFLLIKGNQSLNIEVDYFSKAGSKPEEIIDSYINRQNELKSTGIGFILITDGKCWSNKEKNQLQKGFKNLNYLMNYHLAKNGMLEEAIKDYFKL